MTEAISAVNVPTSPHCTSEAARRRRRRRIHERLFSASGLLAVCIAVSFVLILFAGILRGAIPALSQNFVQLTVLLDASTLGIDEVTEQSLNQANFAGVLKEAVRAEFPQVTEREDRRDLNQLLSSGAGYKLRDILSEGPEKLGKSIKVWLPLDDDADVYVKGGVSASLGEDERRLNDKQVSWLTSLKERGKIESRFNTTLFTAGDSREPELAGVWGAVKGSAYTLSITLLLSFILGVATAVFLEEYAPKNNRWMDLIEVNINNLAAVPSIVFGLLGLAIFINFLGLPRSAPVVAGLVLSLMTLPTVTIASRAALKSVPPSIRTAALGLGASKTQTVLHHVLPLALPGMLTGTIIGMAQALGETAPLLMIGMVAFVVDVPTSAWDPSTVLPVQVYLWSDSPERAFAERTAAAILVLLLFLISMNLLAVLLRRQFERRW